MTRSAIQVDSSDTPGGSRSPSPSAPVQKGLMSNGREVASVLDGSSMPTIIAQSRLVVPSKEKSELTFSGMTDEQRLEDFYDTIHEDADDLIDGDAGTQNTFRPESPYQRRLSNAGSVDKEASAQSDKPSGVFRKIRSALSPKKTEEVPPQSRASANKIAPLEIEPEGSAAASLNFWAAIFIGLKIIAAGAFVIAKGLALAAFLASPPGIIFLICAGVFLALYLVTAVAVCKNSETLGADLLIGLGFMSGIVPGIILAALIRENTCKAVVKDTLTPF